MPSRRRTSIAVALVLITAGAIVGYRQCGGSMPRPAAPATTSGAGSATTRPTTTGPANSRRTTSSIDPRTQPTASIAGTVTSAAGGAIGGAMVCASYADRELTNEEIRVPTCATTDATGAYRIAAVVPGTWSISASAETFVPKTWVSPPPDEDNLDLAPGQARTGVDIVLEGGAARAHGIVNDINGGPVADAWVYVRSDSGRGWGNRQTTAVTRSAADGTFTAWIGAGELTVTAEADGYADGEARGIAPTEMLEVLMSPESVLAGVVVLAGTDTPVPGARVAIEPDWMAGNRVSGSATTDASGRFRITRLPPGRYTPIAIADELYGEPTASVLLGLAQTADDVRIEVHPMASVAGRVVIDDGTGPPRPCPEDDCHVYFAPARVGDGHEIGDTTDADGNVRLRAVLPGTYKVNIFSKTYRSDPDYPEVVVAAAPLAGLTWTVHAGARIVGTVRSKAGAVVAQARVSARSVGGDPRAQRGWASGNSDAAGSFVLEGLTPREYELSVDADGFPELEPGPRVAAVQGQDAHVDIVLEDGGTVVGAVVDTSGKGVRNANIWLRGKRWGNRGARSADDGSFRITGVQPEEYRVGAYRDGGGMLRKPGSTDDDVQGERVQVKVGQEARVRLVVEAQDGVITGTVATADGAAVPDAYLRAIRESDSAGAAAGAAAQESRSDWGNHRPVLTDTDGKFRITELAPGTYTVRAYRKGGGEAIAEHVAVGGVATLVLKATGSISGTVTMAGALPDVLTVGVADDKTGVHRSERFYRTAGAFALRDLPAGTFVVRATVAGAEGTATVTLADGQVVADLRLALTSKVKLRGRLVDLATGEPISGLTMSAAPTTGDANNMSFVMGMNDAKENISGADGRFVIVDAPIGAVTLTGFSMDFANSDYGFVRVPIQVSGSGEVDVGDIKVPKRRVKGTEAGADLGFDLKAPAPGAMPQETVNQVSAVRAGGPAAAAGLKVGDVIVSTDGVDIQGGNHYLAWSLWSVPVGTKVVLGLAGGATVTITAGPQP